MEPGSPLLRKLYRNDIEKAIETVGLDPTEFDRDNQDTEARIKHRWSDSYFAIRRQSGYYVGESVVGDGLTWPYQPRSWQAVMRQFETWLSEVKRDLETPDLWAELHSQARLLKIGSGDLAENTPFTPAEREEMASQLGEVANNIKTGYSLSEPQMRVLNEKVDYLVDAAGRLGRTDWRGVFIATALSFVFSVSLPPETARHIFFTLLQAIAYHYGFPELGG
jgi:hypothetical protein